MLDRSRTTKLAFLLLGSCTAAPMEPAESLEVDVVTSAIRCETEWDCLIQGAGARCVPGPNDELECVECLNDLDCATLGQFEDVCRNERCVTRCPPERCDGLDDDCDGRVDEGLTNECGGPCNVPLELTPGFVCPLAHDQGCTTTGEVVCEGETSACVPLCWYLCVVGDAAAERTQDPCAWAAARGGDTACVPEDPECPRDWSDWR